MTNVLIITTIMPHIVPMVITFVHSMPSTYAVNFSLMNFMMVFKSVLWQLYVIYVE